MNLKLISFFTVGASALPNRDIDRPDSNGNLCTTDALNDIVRANLPSGARFEDYVVRHRVAKNKVSDFGHAHCKASPWQGQNTNPYDHKHNEALEDQFAEFVEDNKFRDGWILRNGGTEEFPAGSGGFFYCLEKSGDRGTWVMSKELPRCPHHDEAGAWNALAQPDPVCDATEPESTETLCGNCLNFQNDRVSFDLETRHLSDGMENWNDRDYTLHDIPAFMSSASELIIQPHKLINSDITLTFSPRLTGDVYAFAEQRSDGNPDRNGNWPSLLPADGWTLMTEKMQWDGQRGLVDLLIWKKSLTNAGSLTLPVDGDELVGGIVLDRIGCSD